MRRVNHNAFYTTLQAPIAETLRRMLPPAPFQGPSIPIIDGRGAIWHAYRSEPGQIWDCAPGPQITAPYDFAAAIRVGLRESAPDLVIFWALATI